MAWIGLGLMTLGGLAGWILRGHHQWVRGSGVVVCHDVHADPNVLPPSAALAGSATPTRETWVCEDCGWTFPIAEPPMGAECDNCGGTLVEALHGPPFGWAGSATPDEEEA
jgi:hypothetical protein